MSKTNTHPLAVWRRNQVPQMTQEALAKKFPVNTWTIKSIEKGRRKPSPELALRISQLTGIPVVALRPDLAAFASPAQREPA